MIFIDINSNNTKKIQCFICNGSGFTKGKPIICKICNGNKCCMCNSTGLERMPWDLCEKCYGVGEVDLKSK